MASFLINGPLKQRFGFNKDWMSLEEIVCCRAFKRKYEAFNEERSVGKTVWIDFYGEDIYWDGDGPSKPDRSINEHSLLISCEQTVNNSLAAYPQAISGAHGCIYAPQWLLNGVFLGTNSAVRFLVCVVNIILALGSCLYCLPLYRRCFGIMR